MLTRDCSILIAATELNGKPHRSEIMLHCLISIDQKPHAKVEENPTKTSQEWVFEICP